MGKGVADGCALGLIMRLGKKKSSCAIMLGILAARAKNRLSYCIGSSYAHCLSLRHALL